MSVRSQTVVFDTFRMGSQCNTIFSTSVEQSRLNFFNQPWARDPARLGSEHGSVWLRIADRFDSELVSQLETRASARFGLYLGSVWSKPGSAQGSTHRSSARLDSLFGTPRIMASGLWLGLGLELGWGLGNQLSARLGSTLSSARGSVRGSAGDWLGNRDSVWIDSVLN